MNRIVYCLSVLPLLCVGCTDPSSVKAFAQSAPPAAEFHALVLDYPGTIAQESTVYAIISNRPVTADPPAAAQTFCSYVPALDRMHAAMIAYMTALGALATAGSAPAAGGGGAAGEATALPDEAQPCPPEFMPVVASVSAAPASPAAPAPAQVTASVLSTDLQNLGKTNAKLGINAANANAAASLVIFFEDVATAVLREEAVHKALLDGHDGFLGAVAIEQGILGFVAENARNYKSNTAQQAAGVLDGLSGQNARLQTIAVRLSLAFNLGQVMTPQQAGAVQTSTEIYLQALGKLKTAYLTLYTTSVSGGAVLTAASWKTIQPLIVEAQNSYAALRKL